MEDTAIIRETVYKYLGCRDQFWIPMRKSLGDKRREIPLERAQDNLKILSGFRDGDTRQTTKDGKEEEFVVWRIFPTTHFGFRKITVGRPLRLNFQASPERIARLGITSGLACNSRRIV